MMRRNFPRLLGALALPSFAALSVGLTVFHLFVLNIYSLEPLMFRAIHVGWGGAIGFESCSAFRHERARGVPWYDWILAAASLACAAHVTVEVDGLLFRGGADAAPPRHRHRHRRPRDRRADLPLAAPARGARLRVSRGEPKRNGRHAASPWAPIPAPDMRATPCFYAKERGGVV